MSSPQEQMHLEVNEAIKVEKIRAGRWLVLVGTIPVGERNTKRLAWMLKRELAGEILKAACRCVRIAAVFAIDIGYEEAGKRIGEVATMAVVSDMGEIIP